MDQSLIAEAIRLLKAAEGKGEGPTVAELWTSWEPWAKTQGGWRTWRYQRDLMLEIRFKLDGRLTSLGDLRWHECDVRAIDAWRAHHMTLTSSRKGPYKPSYRNRLLTTLQGVFSWHINRKTISRHPMDGWRRENEAGGEREGWFSEEQFSALMAHAHPLLRKMALTSFRCGGLRRDEVRLLTKDDVDWDERLIVIRSHRHKNRKAKEVPVTDDVYELLVAQATTVTGRYLFPNPRDPRGGPLSVSTFGDWMRAARERAGIRLMGELPVFHHNRHGYAMNMLLKEAPLPHVMDSMGITSPTAARRYMRLRGQAREYLREKMNQRLEPRKSAPPLTKSFRTERNGG
ncbi:MAG TPA: tyrosine-type recombinase/integrase [Tepidisphaeraceae bacterium]|nr:tyrosine-type recombinase/integrase [Tepidisphaeraceae bacterium]